jgi:hypothetical protein
VTRTIAALAVALVAGPAVAGAQDGAAIARRVAAVQDGEVRLTYSAREGVVGDGRSIIAWDCDGSGRCERQQYRGDFNHGIDDWRHWTMQPGPVRVALRVRSGAVDRVRVYVGGAWRSGDSATDLGVVAAAAATQYLLGLARQQGGRGTRDALFAAVLADSVTIWRDLMGIARDRAVRQETRKQALFWLGQEAADAAMQGVDSIASASDELMEVREAAVFALSQRPAHEGVPALIRIARTNSDRRLRQRAMFWLAQSGDPRAIDLFEEILTRR